MNGFIQTEANTIDPHPSFPLSLSIGPHLSLASSFSILVYNDAPKPRGQELFLICQRVRTSLQDTKILFKFLFEQNFFTFPNTQSTLEFAFIYSNEDKEEGFEPSTRLSSHILEAKRAAANYKLNFFIRLRIQKVSKSTQR